MAETLGRIIHIRHSSQETPRITVEYIVDGDTYRITENITVVSEKIRIGFLPVGQRKKWKIGPVTEGQEVVVLYDEDNPKKGRIRDNDGKIR